MITVATVNVVKSRSTYTFISIDKVLTCTTVWARVRKAFIYVWALKNTDINHISFFSFVINYLVKHLFDSIVSCFFLYLIFVQGSKKLYIFYLTILRVKTKNSFNVYINYLFSAIELSVPFFSNKNNNLI
jgi:hypothetical protein